MSKKYWRGLPELHNSPEFQEQHKNEFAEPLPMDEFLSSNEAENSGTSRRDFLKVMGFSTAAVALAACETPVNRSIPYVVKPEEVTPGVANFYATTFYDGHDYASILVKTREGRPIKIEGNDLKGFAHSGTNARVQASVLGLYDGARLRGPMWKGEAATWKTVDDKIAASLKDGGIRILTSTIISPSTKAVIAEFMAKYPSTKHITYDAISYSALSKANKNVFGKSVVSSYDFSKAKIVVGIACDFLGNWISGEEFSKQYAKNRKVSKENPEMSQHFHFETTLSLTGANADYRYMVKASELGKVTSLLFNEIAKATGNTTVPSTKIESQEALKAISKVATKLLDNKGKSLVVSGLNDEGTQTLINGINKMLDNYGKTLDIDKHLNLKQSNDEDFADLVKDMVAGKVNVLMTYNCNPVYTAPASLKFAEAYNKVPARISFSQVMDETATMAHVVCPDNHYLESWGDANPRTGIYTLQQPTINPIFAQPRHEGTRQFQESLLMWAGLKTDYLTYLQGYWNNRVFPNQGKFLDFPSFWANALHEGAVKVAVSKETVIAPLATDSTGKPLMAGVAVAIAESLNDSNIVVNEAIKTPQPMKAEVVVEENIPTPNYQKAAEMANGVKTSALELFVYEKIGIGNGDYTNNPWLMELPDPISKVTWDNYITMSPIDVKAMGLKEMLRQDIEGSVVDLTVNGITVKVPVYPQPGQTPGTVGLALGYGRNSASLKVANGVGVNAFPFLQMVNGTIQPIVTNVTITKTDDTHEFAATQIQHTIMGREEFLLREVSLKEFKENDKAYWNPAVELTVHGGGKTSVNNVDLWAAHPRPGHKWGMSIDMNLCFGCGACVVACTSENNVAVVGKKEVTKTRDMHWLRIDRYYSSDMNSRKGEEEGLGTKETYIQMENPSANPQVTFQPMMCQHCNHAPCETVCPVLATSHSTEGLNMMTYNRCIGTRYCANNCPFKVRRFNWFNYNENEWFGDFNPAQQELGRMVLNPDVVVRSRGVMEKCSMCQQKLQAGKLEAKKLGMPLKDGAIKTACQSACSTDAIIFGDLNDTESMVSKERNDERTYFLLEDVGVKPTTSYKVKVRNQDEQIIFKKHPARVESKKEETHEEKHA